MKIRPNIGGSILSALAAIYLTAIWYVLLFAATPEYQSVWVAAWESASYVLSEANPNRLLYLGMIASIFISVACSVLFWATGYWRLAMAIVGAHTITTVFVYGLALVAIVGMPLVMAPYCLGPTKTCITSRSS